MNVLFVAPYVPSLVRVRPFKLIQHLAARGHRITLATVWTNAQERAELDELRQYCSEVRSAPLPRWRSLLNCVAALAGDEPLQARYSWSATMAAQIGEARSGADIVHVEHLRGARYGMGGRTAPSRDVPIVWDSVDCISDLFEQAAAERGDRLGRLLSRFELERTRRYEGRVLTEFDRVLVTSSIDKDSLLALSSPVDRTPAIADRVVVLPNGVDLEYFAPSSDLRDKDTLVFSGKMSYHANERAALHMVRDIMPLVWAQRPSTKLVVAGKDPSAALRSALTDRSGRISVTGTVADIRPHLRRAAVAVVPLVYGVGCQNKVLEAMACSTPVVATPRAISALCASAGRDVLVAHSPSTFAQQVIELLDSPRRQREIGSAGRRYVETFHRWDRVAGTLEQIYNEAVSKRRSRGIGTRTELTA